MTGLNAAAPDLDDSEALTPRQIFFAVFPSVMLPMFLGILDQNIVSSALPAIAGSLGEVERISWVVIAYLLANTLAAPLFGYLGDLFGRRRLMFFSLTLFLVSSILCAASPTFLALCGARFLQGFGGGGMMVLSQALIGEAVPVRIRGQFQGYLATNAVMSSLVGPVVGGFLTEHLGWRSIFLFSLPIGVVAFVLVGRLKARPGNRTRGWTFDWGGLFWFSGFIVPTLLALGTARVLLAGEPQVFVGLLAFAVLSLVMLLRHERRVETPFLPVDLLQMPVMWLSDTLAAFHGATIVSLVTFLPLYLRVVRGSSLSEVGLLMLPLSCCIGIGSIFAGRMVSRTGRTMIFPTLGLTGATFTMLFMALGAQYLGPIGLSALLAVNSLLMGSVMGIVQITVQSHAGHGRIGSAAASVQLARSIGASLGTALVGAVLFTVLAVTDPTVAARFDTLLQAGPAALADLGEARRLVVSEEIALAFRAAFLTITIFIMCGIGLAWANPSRRL